VGDYVGQLAGDAAQAVRRAGLRPGLERSFGCAPELVGQVVAQEPPGGSDLARNALVTLYVAAPGVAQAIRERAEQHRQSAEPASPPAKEHKGSPAVARPGGRRRRKATRAAPKPQVFAAPAPVAPGEGGSSDAQDTKPCRTAEHDSTSCAPAWSGAEEQREEVVDGQVGDELAHEEFVVHVDDLFAGRVGGAMPAWRGVYPRRAGQGLRGRLREHPWLVRIAVAMLAVWVTVGVASVLIGHTSPHTGARTKAPGARTVVATGRSSTRHAAARPARKLARARASRHRADAPRRLKRPVAVRSGSVASTYAGRPAAGPSPRPAVVASESALAAANTQPAPAPEQRDGGLFSP
jgi:hypothetical protein